MKVIVDANILISILISSGSKQDLLFSNNITPVTPDWVLFEVGKHWKELCTKTGYSDEELLDSLMLIRRRVKTIPLRSYANRLKEASKISPDTNDTEYFALALKHKCPIWSHDREQKQQTSVEVLNTKELLKKLGLIPDEP